MNFKGKSTKDVPLVAIHEVGSDKYDVQHDLTGKTAKTDNPDKYIGNSAMSRSELHATNYAIKDADGKTKATTHKTTYGEDKFAGVPDKDRVTYTEVDTKGKERQMEMLRFSGDVKFGNDGSVYVAEAKPSANPRQLNVSSVRQQENMAKAAVDIDANNRKAEKEGLDPKRVESYNKAIAENSRAVSVENGVVTQLTAEQGKAMADRIKSEKAAKEANSAESKPKASRFARGAESAESVAPKKPEAGKDVSSPDFAG